MGRDSCDGNSMWMVMFSGKLKKWYFLWIIIFSALLGWELMGDINHKQIAATGGLVASMIGYFIAIYRGM